LGEFFRQFRAHHVHRWFRRADGRNDQLTGRALRECARPFEPPSRAESAPWS
jgi:hypothetical protein